MRNSTLFIKDELNEPELAAALEKQFNAVWFPDYHRCSIDSDDATVYVDFDSEYVSSLTIEEQHSLAVQLGFLPKLALHISTSVYHAGSAQLAELVWRGVLEKWVLSRQESKISVH